MLMAPDPRIEAASDALGLAGHRPPDDALRAAFAAADAVDPLRDDDTLHALVARGIAALYSPEPPDAEDLAEARRVVAAIRGRGRSW